MSVYDRDWYQKDADLKRKRQEAADAMWNEVEPSHRAKRSSGTSKSTSRQTAASPKEKVIPSCCPHCGFTTQLRVSSAQLNAYSYICPTCKTKISVITGKNQDKTNSQLLSILGILALVIYFLSQFDKILALFT